MADRLTICSSCAARGASPEGAELARQLRQLVGPSTEVLVTDCMNVCSKPVTVSMRAAGKAAYLFAGVDPKSQAAELATFARLYSEAEGGIIEDARPLGRLRHCLIGRIPA